MTQQRQIREAIKARLEAQLPGVPVHLAPRFVVPDSGLPCVGIFSRGDRPLDEGDHAKAHSRIYTLRIEVAAKGRPEEDATDDLAVAVRTAILTDDSLTDPGQLGLASGIFWVGQDWDGEEGDEPEAKTGLDFDIYYRWRPE